MSVAEDRDEIRQLLARYVHAIDAGRGDDWAATFTDDGVFDMNGRSIQGAEALRAFAEGRGGARHVVANEVIDVDGDEARVQAYVFVFAGTPPAGTVSGSYEDALQRVDGRWRFTKRAFTPDAPA
jgi:uncharacterized protein (TIGR02246 family)